MDRQKVPQRSGEDSSGVCGGFVRICILRVILFLAHPPPCSQGFVGRGMGRGWGVDGEEGPQERVVKQKLPK